MTQIELPLSRRNLTSQSAATKPTQCEILLQALRNGERLTVAIALERYGVFALSQRCGELKRAGHPIQSRLIVTPTGKHVSEYWI